jgi:hypothetical protein
VIAIGVAFLFGVVTTVYLSLRSPEVTVPNVLGKDRFEAEKILRDADLNFRVRAARPSNQAKPDTVLFQLPRAGEVVKAGQTVAMDISRAAKEGETPETVKPSEAPAAENVNADVSNENKPKRNKNTNKNSNDNANTNDNANAKDNANRHSNVNRPAPNSNSTLNANVTPRGNVNGAEEPNSNSRSRVIQNDNRRPPQPKPSPTERILNRESP